MTPTKLRVEEMNRLCFWFKVSHSGSMFGVNVLGLNSDIVSKVIYPFKVNEYEIYILPIATEFLKQVNKKYTIHQVINFMLNPSIELGYSDSSYFRFIREVIKSSDKKEFTIVELFKAYFIFKYYNKFNNEFNNPRVVPVILVEPHMNAPERSMWIPLIKSFKYHMILGSMRNPVMSSGRFFESSTKGNNNKIGFLTVFDLYKYFMPENVPKEFIDKWYLYRFEDLKLHPKETLIEICKAINVPYDDKMLSSEYSWNLFDGTVKGFDTAPLHRDLSFAFSDYDKVRMQIFFNPLLKYFGYEHFDDEECPINENDVYNIFKLPFRFEKRLIEQKGINDENEIKSLRNYFHQVMFKLYMIAKNGNIFLPKLIKPKLKEE